MSSWSSTPSASTAATPSATSPRLPRSSPDGRSASAPMQNEDVQAQFDPTKHEPGSKQVLGVTIKENGEREAIEVLHILATSPKTAQFLSTKLAVRFVSDNPPPAMVDRMAKTFLATNGDIRQVLLTMINSPEFFTARPTAPRSKPRKTRRLCHPRLRSRSHQSRCPRRRPGRSRHAPLRYANPQRLLHEVRRLE